MSLILKSARVLANHTARATKLQFDYLLDPKAAREPFLVSVIYHDDSLPES